MPLTLEEKIAAMHERRAKKKAKQKAKRDAKRRAKKKIRMRFYMRRYRARLKHEARAARHAEIVALETARSQRRTEREAAKSLRRTKKLGRSDGFIAGWNSTESLTPQQAAHFRRGYIQGHAEGRVERARVDQTIAAVKPPSSLQPSCRLSGQV
jgi:hypothetical protein